MEVERGVDLLALALLIATLRDWLVICHKRVPVVYYYELVQGMAMTGEMGGNATYTETRSQHAGCDDQVGEDE